MEPPLERAHCCGGGPCGRGVSRIRNSRNFSLFVITVALFLDFLLLLAMVPILPVYGKALGLTPTEVGLLFSIKPIAGIFAAPIMGLVSDRVGRKWPMVVGLFASAGFSVLFAFSTTFWQLLLARLLQGVASSSNAAAFAFLADVFPDSKERGKKIAVAVMGISSGVMLGPLFGGYLYEAGGVKLPFLVGAGLLVLDGIGRGLIREPRSRAAALPTPGDAPSDSATAQQLAAATGELPDAVALSGVDVRLPRHHHPPSGAFPAPLSPTGTPTGTGASETSILMGPASPQPSQAAFVAAAGTSSSDEWGSARAGASERMRQQMQCSSHAEASDVPTSRGTSTFDSDKQGVETASPPLVATPDAHDFPRTDTGPQVGTLFCSAQKGDSTSVHIGSDAPVAQPALELSNPEVVSGKPAASISYFAMLKHGPIMTLAFALLCGNAAIALVEVVLPLYLDAELHLSSGDIGALYAGGNALYVIIAKPATWLGNKVGRWRLVSVGCALMGISMPLMPVVKSLYWLVPLWLICSGMGMSLIDVSCNPELADLVDADFPGAYGRVYAIAQVGVSIGFIVGPLIGTAMVQYVNFHGAFAILGVAVALYSPVIALVFKGVERRALASAAAELKASAVALKPADDATPA